MISDLGGKGLQLVVSLAMSVALARALGASEFGVYSFVVATISLLAILPRFGSDHNLMRALTGALASGSSSLAAGAVRFFGLFLTASSIGTMLLVALLLYTVQNHVPIDYVQPLFFGLLLLPGYIFLVVWQNGVRSFQKVLQAQLPELGYRALIAVGALASLVFAFPLMANHAILLTALAAGVASVWCYVMLQQLMPQYHPPIAYRRREWIALSLPLLVSGGANIFLSQTDIIMLGLFASSEETGIYTVASRLSNISQIVLIGVTAIGGQRAAHFFALNDREGLQTLATTIARWATASFIPTAAMIIVSAPFFLPFFGPGFEEAIGPLTVLIIGQFAIAASGTALILLTMTDGQMIAAVTLATGALVNALLNYLLIPEHGMLGAAIATVTATALIQVVLVITLRLKRGLNSTILRRPQFMRFDRA